MTYHVLRELRCDVRMSDERQPCTSAFAIRRDEHVAEARKRAAGQGWKVATVPGGDRSYRRDFCHLHAHLAAEAARR